MNRNVIGHKPVIGDGDPERVHDDWAHGPRAGTGYPVEYCECGHGYWEYSSHSGSADHQEAEDDHKLFCRVSGDGWLAGGDFGTASGGRLQLDG